MENNIKAPTVDYTAIADGDHNNVVEERKDEPCNTNKTRARSWSITINNYENSDLDRITQLEKAGNVVIWQKEKGANGTPHIQGAIRFKNSTSFNVVKTHFPKAHIEVCRNWAALKKYCQKVETRDEEPIDDPLADKELYDWQKEILEMIKEKADDRTIHWYYDPIGCKGKTTLAKHICMRGDAIYVTGKAADIKHGVVDWITSRKKLGTVFIDLTRSVENFVSYQGIEEIKNGIFFSTKYESKMVIFNCPHVIVFANFAPDESKLSMDRWRIIKIE